MASISLNAYVALTYQFDSRPGDDISESKRFAVLNSQFGDNTGQRKDSQ